MTLNSDLPSSAEVQEIRIQWWGISRSKSLDIQIDDSSMVKYKEPYGKNNRFKYNSWQTFQINSNGKRLKFKLDDGVKDPWGKNKNFGIRNIEIIGIFKEDAALASSSSNQSLKLRKFMIETVNLNNDAETSVMIDFVVQKYSNK